MKHKWDTCRFLLTCPYTVHIHNETPLLALCWSHLTLIHIHMYITLWCLCLSHYNIRCYFTYKLRQFSQNSPPTKTEQNVHIVLMCWTQVFTMVLYMLLWPAILFCEIIRCSIYSIYYHSDLRVSGIRVIGFQWRSVAFTQGHWLYSFCYTFQESSHISVQFAFLNETTIKHYHRHCSDQLAMCHTSGYQKEINVTLIWFESFDFLVIILT